MNFANAAFQTPDSRTENGAATFASSLDVCTDLFFRVGASRGKVDEVTAIFEKALREDTALAIRIALHARDARGGVGERAIFRSFLLKLPLDTQVALIPKIVELGRWDDLGTLIEKGHAAVAWTAGLFWRDAVQNGNGLAAKWAPRKGTLAVQLRKIWNMTPKQYRKTLVLNTNVVETQMCSKNWNEINFEHVPSVAASRYNKAFYKNAPVSYAAYKNALVKGEAKINASAIFPHDIVRAAGQYGTDGDVINAQWKALPNYLENVEGNILVLSDVSGSMECGLSGSVTAMDVSVALGLYVSERLPEPWKDLVMTFETSPKFHKVHGKGIVERVHNLKKAPWGGSTNLQAAFDLILDTARRSNVAQSEMPGMLLIISDMEFNSACRGLTNYQAMADKFRAAGYEMPKVVFWNLNSRTKNSPVRYNENNVGLVSGFSPAILGSVFKAKQFDPMNIMLQAVMVERYDVPGVTL